MLDESHKALKMRAQEQCQIVNRFIANPSACLHFTHEPPIAFRERLQYRRFVTGMPSLSDTLSLSVFFFVLASTQSSSLSSNASSSSSSALTSTSKFTSSVSWAQPNTWPKPRKTTKTKGTKTKKTPKKKGDDAILKAAHSTCWFRNRDFPLAVVGVSVVVGSWHGDGRVVRVDIRVEFFFRECFGSSIVVGIVGVIVGPVVVIEFVVVVIIIVVVSCGGPRRVAFWPCPSSEAHRR